MSFVPFDNESNKTSVFKKNLLIQVINDIEKLMREVYEQPRIYETGLSQELPDIFGFGSEDGWIDITLRLFSKLKCTDDRVSRCN